MKYSPAELAMEIVHCSNSCNCAFTAFGIDVTIYCDTPDQLTVPKNATNNWKYVKGFGFLNERKKQFISIQPLSFYSYPMEPPEPAED